MNIGQSLFRGKGRSEIKGCRDQKISMLPMWGSQAASPLPLSDLHVHPVGGM